MLFILREDDSNWPKKNIVGKQELEIRVGGDHISFEVRHTHIFIDSLLTHFLDSQDRFPG